MRLFKTLATLSFFGSAWATILGHDLFFAALLFLVLVCVSGSLDVGNRRTPVVMTTHNISDVIKGRLDELGEDEK